MASLTSYSLTLNGCPFYIHPYPVGNTLSSLQSSLGGLEAVAATALTIGPSSVEEFPSILADFASADDVYSAASEDFGKVLILHSPDDVQWSQLADGLQKYNSSIKYLRAAQKLADGPYFVLGDSVHQAWRLYEDHLDAFMISTSPENPTDPVKYSPLRAATESGVWKPIAVPSRLYTRGSSKPLAGARIAIKDCFDVAGIQTTQMSRPYMEVFGPVRDSADYVQRLITLGATIVGKTKMTAFAASDEPTDQYIDFHCPFNPRGDGYQSPSGSSTGAAAALAGYPWLDYSIGADTAGSIRAPATCNGLFSLRTSYNSTSLKGVTAGCHAFDVVGLLGRDIDTIRTLVHHTLDVGASKKYPSKILYPIEFFPHSNELHQAMVEEYIETLENFLGVKRIKFSLAQRWSQCPPTAAGDKPLKEYLSQSAFAVQCYDYYHIFKPYRDQYKQKFGKEPYAGPIVTYRWNHGESVSDDQNRDHRRKLEVFREWFNDNVLSASDDLLSNAIMIMPYGGPRPKYRDAPNEPPCGSNTIGEKFISPVLQVPQLVLPIGQMPYKSKVTGRLEHRPIAGTLIGAKGSDMMLLNLAMEAFQQAGWPTRVNTGRYMFELANNTRNVAPMLKVKI